MTHEGRDDSLPRRAFTRSRRRRACAFIFTLVPVALGAGGGHAPAPAPRAERQPVKVGVVSPVYEELPRYVRATGTLHGDEEATIASKVAGRVIEIAADLGDAAPSGALLARIDPTDYELARNEREQAFREVLASIGLESLSAEAFAVDSLPAVERARLQAENAKARYERGKVLAERRPPLISEQDFADLKTSWDVAESNLRVERLSAEATLAEARTLEAQVRVAQQRVEDTSVRAPLETAPAAGKGRAYEIASRSVSVGDFVQIGTPLFRLVDPSPLKLRVAIPERRAGAIAQGQVAEVSVESRADRFRGTVARVSPAVDALTRNFMVEIHVPNDDRRLKPGSFGIAEILVDTDRGLVVPRDAVVTFAGVHKVVAVVENKAQEKRVELGQVQGDMVEILSGLTESDVIVARPSGSLTTGTPIAAERSTADAGESAP
jgi:RND family efflux transporter MFP subunit